jgi:hypothetical protein
MILEVFYWLFVVVAAMSGFWYGSGIQPAPHRWYTAWLCVVGCLIIAGLRLFPNPLTH